MFIHVVCKIHPRTEQIVALVAAFGSAAAASTECLMLQEEDPNYIYTWYAIQMEG